MIYIYIYIYIRDILGGGHPKKGGVRKPAFRRKFAKGSPFFGAEGAKNWYFAAQKAPQSFLGKFQEMLGNC